MKKIALYAAAAALLVGIIMVRSNTVPAGAQSAPQKSHKVIFEVNVDGLETWQSIMNNVENLEKALGKDNIKIELVCHGKGLNMLLTTDAPLIERMRTAKENGVVWNACENTMRRRNVKKEDLPAFATTVPSGVTEVVLKQEQGWPYLKAGF